MRNLLKKYKGFILIGLLFFLVLSVVQVIFSIPKVSFAQDSSNGLWASYYNDNNFTDYTFSRVDPNINFDWGYTSPDSSVGPDTFSVRWEGYITPPHSQLYTFEARTDDGVRLWINNQLVINQWRNQSARTIKGSIKLNAGVKYPIKMEYFEGYSKASASLFWRSYSIKKEIVPASVLTPEALPTPTPTPTLRPTPTRIPTPTPVPDTTSPSVTIIHPPDGSQLSGTVRIMADASDNVKVRKVEFYLNGVLKYTDSYYSYSWSLYTKSYSNGSYTITTKAYDTAGNSNTHSINVTINNSLIPTLTAIPTPTLKPTSTPTPRPTATPTPTRIPTPTPVPCTLSSASWSVSEVVSANTVELQVLATGSCSSKQVLFSVKQENGAISINKPSPNPVYLVQQAGTTTYTATTSWKADNWSNTCLSGTCNPTYFFTATIVNTTSVIESFPKYITVTQPVNPTPTSTLTPTIKPTSTPTPTSAPCTLTSASWGGTTAVEGTNVNITVNATGACNSKQVNTVVRQSKTGLPDGDAVNQPSPNPVSLTLNGTVYKATVTWKADTWTNACIIGTCDPVYFAKANIVGDTNVIETNPRLITVTSSGITPTPTPTPSSTKDKLAAFPEAEGFGAQSVGGRGGKVYEVTNLNDSGTGSLRECIAASGARTCVFKVGGTINLLSNLSISNPYITIAGQTSPGGGITIRGGTLSVKTNDVIIRHIRVRLGNMNDDKDTIYIEGSNVIFDHVSASWSIDETFSAADSKNITIQWSIISEPLNDADHIDGPHGFCSLLRGSLNVSVHHNLYAHCVRRSPQTSFKGAYQEKVQIVNNLMYDYIEAGTRIKVGDTTNPSTGYTDVINNRYLPKGTSTPPEIYLDSDLQNAKLYINGNIGPRRQSDTIDQWALVKNYSSLSRSQLEASAPFAPTGITTYDALTSAEIILNNAGTTLPKRDSVDERIINEVKTGTGQVIDCVTGCTKSAPGGWPTIETGTPYLDSDHDGMSDTWETKYGFNSKSALDGNQDADSDGYTNLEEFLNGTLPNQNATSQTNQPSQTPTPTPASTTIWKPALNTSWQWQLTTPVDQSVNATMFDIDLFDNDASVVSSLHAKGKKVICYISTGSYENWRPDAGKFPQTVLGNNNGWPGEKWLDIRRIDILGPIMEARMDLCKSKGFDGIEPDNIDGYSNNTGFPLTYQDQINYNKFLANAAHARGLSIGLKNDVDQVSDLVPYFDWALNEECFQYNECDTLLPFINAGKAVFNVEYKLDTSQFCTKANSMNFNSMKKNLDLDAWRIPCR